MTNLNRITLLGHLGREPKSGATQAGKLVTRFSVATNKRYKDDDAQWQQTTQWHNCVVFGPTAEYAAKLPSGTLVFLEGEMTYREYERDVETAAGSIPVNWPMAEVLVFSISAVMQKNKAGKPDPAA
jgi:single-strand DNA-binding protein